jgi:fucose permease
MALELSWRWGYSVAIGLEARLAAVFFSFGSSRMQPRDGPAVVREKRRLRADDRYPLLLGCVTFFLYSGIEVTAGLWAYSFLTVSFGTSRWLAGTWVSVYWAALAWAGLCSEVLSSARAPTG